MRVSRRRLRSLAIVLLAAFAIELLPFNAAKAASGSPGRIENVRAERDGGQVIVYYDLMGGKDEAYSVTVTLKREDIPLFKYTPKNISGDVGDDVIPGVGKKIVWEVAKEIPSSQTDDVFYFVVEATVAGGGISPLVWIGGGAALVGGVAFLLFSKKGDDPGATTAQGFPPEPARPK